jgi:hypothetical protein
MHGSRVAATGDLRDHGLPALGYGKLLDLSVQENSRLERDEYPLTGCPLESNAPLCR